MRLSIAIIFWLLSGFAAQADAFDYGAFSRIPIQHEGRIKPLNTFALVHLERFHGGSEMDGEPAIAWLAATIFNPADAMEKPVFLVKDADAQAMLNLPERPDHLYSFSEVTEAIAINRKLVQPLLDISTHDLSGGQRTVVELYENTALFTQIALSNTLFLHLAVELPPEEIRQLDIKNAPSTFVDYFQYMPLLQKSLKDIIARKGTALDQYTPSEMQLARAVERIALTQESSANNVLLRVVPPQWGHDDAWLAPWAMFHAGQGSPQSAELMKLWRDAATAYQEHDAARWKQATSVLAQKMESAPGVRPEAIALEILYYQWWPLGMSMIFYMVALVMTLLALSGVRSAWPHVIAFAATYTGACWHFAAIAARVAILQRPPVGTLYESLLFVSLIAVLFGLFLEWRMRNSLGLLVASLAGSLLLFASQSFSGDDTMSMLIAVLNTNFWLATHVLCITTGYGFGIVAGIIAHTHLIMRCMDKDHDKTRQVLRGGYGTALIALLFTSLGTILGGIWADQSWGRFWGWDPKENGALMICLWLIWLLHGRISGRMHERGFAVLLALLNVVIALSWLGVNLLSTGLHSYGFTDKAAWSLGAFCAAECAFAGVTYLILWRRDRAALL